MRLSAADRALLDAQFPAGILLRVPRAQRHPHTDATGEVVVVMGMPGAGKSTAAQEYVARGFRRLNRDEAGGRLSALVRDLDAGLVAGQRHWVLDNTYAARAARNEVIECAWTYGLPVRCVFLDTTLADAQINAVTRLLEAHGRLPSPDELRAQGKTDHRYFGPDAQFRYERTFEPPVMDEGFSHIEQRAFVRRVQPEFTRKALMLEYDDVLCTSAGGAPAVRDVDDVRLSTERRAVLAHYAAQGWVLCALAWRPDADPLQLHSMFEKTRELLGLEIDIAYCPHPAGPPVCWCRKPLPGLVLEFAQTHRLALGQSIMVGRAPADRTLAQRLRMTYHDAPEFFGKSTRP